MGDNIIWLIIMIPVSLLFTLLGVYAWRRKEPMWFWAGSTVKKYQIKDVKAYNRANGVMWLAFSVPLWVGTVLGIMNVSTGGIVIGAGILLGIPFLVVAYAKIYKKYKR